MCIASNVLCSTCRRFCCYCCAWNHRRIFMEKTEKVSNDFLPCQYYLLPQFFYSIIIISCYQIIHPDFRIHSYILRFLGIIMLTLSPARCYISIFKLFQSKIHILCSVLDYCIKFSHHFSEQFPVISSFLCQGHYFALSPSACYYKFTVSLCRDQWASKPDNLVMLCKFYCVYRP